MTTQFMKSLDFTEEDLEYNRKGVLSPRQNARVISRRRALKLLLLSLGGLLACVGGGILTALGILSLSQDASAAIGMLVGAGVFALFGAPLIYLGVKPMRSVKVAVVRGIGRVARVQRTRRTNNVSSTDERSPES